MFGLGKGKIVLALPTFQYRQGEQIDGVLNLDLKKPLQAKKLQVRLLATQKRQVKETSNGRTYYRSIIDTIFDFPVVLAGEKTYPAGQAQFPFKILIPRDAIQKPASGGAVGAVLQGISMMSGVGMVEWQLAANLDVSGLDVKTSVKLNIA
ncbi:MAG: hypothetical protein ABIA93_01660 [Candidatus Woesearchaeota archaeon]